MHGASKREGEAYSVDVPVRWSASARKRDSLSERQDSVSAPHQFCKGLL